jgi:hypothetical protein
MQPARQAAAIPLFVELFVPLNPGDFAHATLFECPALVPIQPVESERIRSAAKSGAVRSSLQNVYTTGQELTNFCQMPTHLSGEV